MSEEKIGDILEVIAYAISSGTGSLKIKCPHCGKDSFIQRLAVYGDNKMTMKVSLADGHMLQAKTLGGIMTNIDSLFKAAAKQMGVKIEVLVGNVNFSENEIAIDYYSVALPKTGSA